MNIPRTLLLFVTASTALNAQAAHLKCNLEENNSITQSFERPVSIDGIPGSFQFTESLEGKDFVASVNWNENLAELSVRKKTDAVAASEYREWDKPLEEFFALDHGNASLRCSIDVSDGQSYRWTSFRKAIGLDADRMSTVLDSYRDLANRIPVNPKEEAELNSGLCFLIGNFQNSDPWRDLSLKLASFSLYRVGHELFPKAGEYLEQLLTKIAGMDNFCTEGLVKDPNPIPFQDRKSLAVRTQEIQQIVRKALSYIDQRFSNKPKAQILP